MYFNKKKKKKIYLKESDLEKNHSYMQLPFVYIFSPHNLSSPILPLCSLYSLRITRASKYSNIQTRNLEITLDSLTSLNPQNGFRILRTPPSNLLNLSFFFSVCTCLCHCPSSGPWITGLIAYLIFSPSKLNSFSIAIFFSNCRLWPLSGSWNQFNELQNQFSGLQPAF